MKKQIKLAECEGRVLKKIILNGDVVILAFDDGWLALKAWGQGCDEEPDIGEMTSKLDWGREWLLVDAGVMTEAERVAKCRSERESDRKKQEEKDRKEFERLSKKFCDAAVEPKIATETPSPEVVAAAATIPNDERGAKSVSAADVVSEVTRLIGGA